ncbi:hypothetical protein NIIDMKKI_68320 [Mycobacterium kansasii]|uniref:Uncharacterized protein n=1 Tax=Mycobacterium kansasii TaxID=1768 RepID=A0A7G1IKU6_MYCKA|nr:hypothetical protein NIIDMKKI_68320 [Mycobacterium kansasii]
MIGALRSVGSHPAAELRIRQYDDVAAAAITGHLPQEPGDGFVERLQQPLLCVAFVGVGVESAELHGVDAGRHPPLTAAATMFSWVASELWEPSVLMDANAASVVRASR